MTMSMIYTLNHRLARTLTIWLRRCLQAVIKMTTMKKMKSKLKTWKAQLKTLFKGTKKLKKQGCFSTCQNKMGLK